MYIAECWHVILIIHLFQSDLLSIHNEGGNKSHLILRPEFYLKFIDGKFKIKVENAVVQHTDSPSKLRHSFSNCFAQVYFLLGTACTQ